MLLAIDLVHRALRTADLLLKLGQDPLELALTFRSFLGECLALLLSLQLSTTKAAWAKLGRMHRVIAKYADDLNEQLQAEGYRQAEAAFERALALNPDLSVTHNLYTALELERGRSKQAMLRLLERAKVTSADANLFAGLVPACRYCGPPSAPFAPARTRRGR